MKHKKRSDSFFSKAWHFIWEEDSLLSWAVNLVIAFVLIKFVVYPGLGLLLGTTHPVVAVVSGSMEHRLADDGSGQYVMCGSYFEDRRRVDFDFFWTTCGSFYGEFNVTRDDFRDFSFHNGFNTGDIIVLLGRDPEDLDVGDVIVFNANRPDPIIHRIIDVNEAGGLMFFTTKGDHNPGVWSFEKNIPEDRVIGKAVFRIPYVGYIKIWFVELVNLLTGAVRRA